MKRFLTELAGDERLNRSELRLLLHLAAAGGKLTRKELAKVCGYHKVNLSRTLSGLLEKDWAAREGLTIQLTRLTNRLTPVNKSANTVNKSANSDLTGFDQFWEVYPRKKSKQKSLQIWTARGLEKLADKIVADVRSRMKRERTWQETKYIPYPSTYLNQSRWEDEIEEIGKANGGKPQTQSQWEQWGKDHNIEARPGESWDAYLRRVHGEYERRV